MTDPVFMSPEHVDVMNARLSAAPEVAAAAAKMPRAYELQYTLHNTETDGTEYWLMTLGPEGVRFGLEPSTMGADLTFVGEYWRMVEVSRAARQGDDVDGDAGMKTEGDLGTLEAIAELFAVAQAVGAVPVSWPER